MPSIFVRHHTFLSHSFIFCTLYQSVEHHSRFTWYFIMSCGNSVSPSQHSSYSYNNPSFRVFFQTANIRRLAILFMASCNLNTQKIHEMLQFFMTLATCEGYYLSIKLLFSGYFYNFIFYQQIFKFKPILLELF